MLSNSEISILIMKGLMMAVIRRREVNRPTSMRCEKLLFNITFAHNTTGLSHLEIAYKVIS